MLEQKKKEEEEEEGEKGEKEKKEIVSISSLKRFKIQEEPTSIALSLQELPLHVFNDNPMRRRFMKYQCNRYY